MPWIYQRQSQQWKACVFVFVSVCGLSLRWERVSGVVGINVFDYCFNQNIFLFFFPAIGGGQRGNSFFKEMMCLGGKTKDCRTPDDHPGRKGHFSKRVRNSVQNWTKMAWKMLLFIFSFFQIFSFSQRNWYCPVWIMGRSDSFCSTFLNFLNLQE